MIWNFFASKGKPRLGIDIGTSATKIVEINLQGEKAVLNNYGILRFAQEEISLRSSSFKLMDKQLAATIREIIGAARMQAKDAYMAIPAFSTFSTIIELPRIPKNELNNAVLYEVRKFIPVPLAEVKLDWLVLDFLSKEHTVKVLTIAVPNDIIDMYYRIAKLSGLNLQNIEIETFSAARALEKKKDTPFVILDIGTRNTNITIVEKGIASIHHNVDLSGRELSRVLVRGLGIDMARAEELKVEKGLEGDPQIADLLANILNAIFLEVQRLVQGYAQQGGSKPAFLMLCGGSAHMKGLAAYAERILNIKTFIGNPFESVAYPPALKETLEELGPSFSVALGLALRKNNL